MAGDAVVGALRVVLGMDTAEFETKLDKTKGAAESWVSGLTKVVAGLAIGALIKEGLEKAVEAFKKTSEEIDKLGKTAQKVGVPVEELSKLKVAAELSDVSMETLSKGLGILSQNMLKAAKGGGEAREKFDDLGISVTDGSGKVKSASTVLAEVAGKFETTADGAVKTARAMELFGKSGKELIPLLNEGKKGIEEAGEIAEHFGLVITDLAKNRAQLLNDNLKILGYASQGFVMQVTQGLLPAFVNWSESAVKAAKGTDVIKQSADLVINAIKEIVVWFAYEASAAVSLWEQLVKLKDAAVALGTEGFDAAAKHMAEFNRIGEESAAKAQEAADKVRESFTRTTIDVKKGVKELQDVGTTAFSKEIDKLVLQANVLGGVYKELPAGFAALAVQLKLTSDNALTLGTSWDQLTARQQQLALALLNLQARQTEFDNQTPFEKYNNALKQLQLQYDKVGLSADVFEKARMKAAADLAVAYGQQAKDVVSGWSEAFRILAEKNKEFAVAAKTAAIAEAIVNTYLAATKALASGFPPFNYIAAAGVVAAGLANVAKISAQQFAHGGSFKVGGAGGIDSQLVQFKATPGEMVDVRRPQDVNGNAANVNVTITGDRISRDQVRDLFKTLNQGMRDGYRLQLVGA